MYAVESHEAGRIGRTLLARNPTGEYSKAEKTDYRQSRANAEGF
jgi:hypothetical protein